MVTQLRAEETGSPAFALRFANDTFRSYSGPRVSDEWIDARVDPLGEEQWQLTLTVKDAVVVEVWFPRDAERVAVNGSLDDDIVYYPYRTGVAEKATAADEEWWGEAYPGACFSPLVVFADDRVGRIVAATNWPPKYVVPLYVPGRAALRYDERVARNSTQRYRALVAEVKGDAARGEDPWRLALDRYRQWLVPKMREADLYPTEYPPALRKAHGWMHVRLDCLPKFNADVIADLRKLYDKYGNVLPWFQFWGQMSNYHRDPPEGRSQWPDPPLKTGEKAGCCLDIPIMHSRYLSRRDNPAIDLPKFASEITAKNGHVGYYVRPKSPYGDLSISKGPDLAFLKNWISENEKHGANAHYLDVLGAVYLGDPLTVAKLFKSGLPPMSVIEWPVDIYPAAFLISGSLWGGKRFDTKPEQTPMGFGVQYTRVTFPRFGRCLLDRQIMFLGCSNVDFVWWGKYRGYEYWTERQAFLLGAKFDAPTQFKGYPGWIEPVNEAVRKIVDERDRAGWWEKEPVYLDRAGVYDVPQGVDVRRFRGSQGEELLVIDNWKRRKGSFRFLGRTLELPDRELAILVNP